MHPCLLLLLKFCKVVVAREKQYYILLDKSRIMPQSLVLPEKLLICFFCYSSFCSVSLIFCFSPLLVCCSGSKITALECLEAIASGLYSELFTLIISLINRFDLMSNSNQVFQLVGLDQKSFPFPQLKLTSEMGRHVLLPPLI